MADILTTDITNKTELEEGTGIFDLFMESVDLHLDEQYDEGRITGVEYATVYLGSLQAVLQQSVTFALEKQLAARKAELIEEQILESQANQRLIDEQMDLVIAQTAKAYEDVKASQERTIRENLLNNANLDKIAEEIDLLQSQDLEVIASTARQDRESEAKITDLNYSIAIKAQQELKLKYENGNVIVTYTYYVDGISGATTTTTDFDNVIGPVISTTITVGSDVSTTELEKQILKGKDLLIAAQTLGFKTDTKQKLLKQMHDGYAVNLTIAGIGNVPEANQDAAIDALAQEILNDVGTSVTIPGEQIPPAPGG